MSALLAALLLAPAADAPVSFVRDVAPVLRDHCLACHDAKRRSGKYEMTTLTKILAGGTTGEAVTPGDPAESELYRLLVTTDERRMPPREQGDAVPADKAELVRRWIVQGAKPDAGLDPDADLLKELRARWVPPTPPERYPHPAIVNALAFAPDGRSLVAGGHHELTVWSVPDGKLIKRVRMRAERAYALEFLRDGTLAVAGARPGQEGDVTLYDLSGPGPVLDGVNDPKVRRARLVELDDAALCLAVSRDGTRLAAGGCDRAARVWDVSGPAPKLEQTVENHADWVFGVAFSADGRHLLTASRDKTAKVWDLAARESVVTFTGHSNTVYAVAGSDDSKAVISAAADSRWRAWNVADEGKQAREGGHNGDIYRLVRHPSRPEMLTSSGDRTVKVWNRDNGSQVRTLEGLTDDVFALAVSADGRFAAGGAYNGEVAVWSLDDGKRVGGWVASPGAK